MRYTGNPCDIGCTGKPSLAAVDLGFRPKTAPTRNDHAVRCSRCCSDIRRTALRHGVQFHV